MLRQISIEGRQANYAQLNPNQPKTIILVSKHGDFGHLFPLEEPQKTADVILQIINQPKIRANIGSK